MLAKIDFVRSTFFLARLIFENCYYHLKNKFVLLPVNFYFYNVYLPIKIRFDNK